MIKLKGNYLKSRKKSSDIDRKPKRNFSEKKQKVRTGRENFRGGTMPVIIVPVHRRKLKKLS